jgi:hypothetical protein
MIRKLSALGRVLELARRERPTAFVRQEPDHKPCLFGSQSSFHQRLNSALTQIRRGFCSRSSLVSS